MISVLLVWPSWVRTSFSTSPTTGHSVGVYNRTTATTDEFVHGLKNEPADKVHPGTAERIQGYHEHFVASLKSPRRIMIMVKAGKPVDAVIDQLKPLLEPGDIFIDGGNSDFRDTNRRNAACTRRLVHRDRRFRWGRGGIKGPSIMPGGHHDAWPFVKDIFQAISAKVGENNDIPCCDWVGDAGAGHYVKMVHNGIEYGDMQLICEAYFILKHALGLTNEELYELLQVVERRGTRRLPDRDHPRHLHRERRGHRRSSR